ncbi:hypothetical protein FE257_005965 [Aspergillus nanangensis]|uniref:Uncharacterized protein n=1 Tax=Aspergillus nanangensis TaxID=2582783 RepID=A0AAD4CAC5_ASPNN|nr:hypothetical protein FE257_005965 [Aspergillus nanangensis]
MDLFLYNPTYQAWICTAPRCQFAVSPSSLDRHLQRRHRDHHAAATPAQRQEILRTMLQRAWVDPDKEIICRSDKVMQNHRREKHQDQDGSWKRGRQSNAHVQLRLQKCLVDRVVSCQRFYRTRTGSQFFEVSSPAGPAPNRGMQETASLSTPAAIIRARVEQALQEGQAAAEQVDG